MTLVAPGWRAVRAGDAAFGIAPLAMSAVVRITTDRRAFTSPSTMQEAFGFCNALLRQPHCRTVVPGERHWAIFQHLCVATGIAGRRVTDAWFAALAIESGCEWITFDRDYARFPGLRWRAPAAE